MRIGSGVYTSWDGGKSLELLKSFASELGYSYLFDEYKLPFGAFPYFAGEYNGRKFLIRTVNERGKTVIEVWHTCIPTAYVAISERDPDLIQWLDDAVFRLWGFRRVPLTSPIKGFEKYVVYLRGGSFDVTGFFDMDLQKKILELNPMKLGIIGDRVWIKDAQTKYDKNKLRQAIELLIHVSERLEGVFPKR